MTPVAALYIDPRGPYPKLADWSAPFGEFSPRVQCWDARRDARKYEGPAPIVAHPPCGPWGRLRHLYCGNEHDCGPRAVEQVRRWGGVLEHPAGSLLWETLPAPHNCHHLSRAGYFCVCNFWHDSIGGFTVEVDQMEWGHVARKRTWLYIVGVSRERVAELVAQRPFPGREPTRSVSGERGAATRVKYPNWKPQLPRCSDTQRRRTPPAFAEFLVSIARSVSTPRVAP